MKYWLLALSILLFIPNVFNRHLVGLGGKPGRPEDFNPQLANRIKSLAKLENYIDSVIELRSKTTQVNTELNVDVINSTVRMRFFHGYSHYSLRENWLAALSGKLIWYDLSAIVIADDILQYPMAACSQQAIVLMELFKRKKIPFRKIAFDHHFAVEAYINKQWIYLDPNLEPEFQGTHRSFKYLKEGNRLKEIYKNILPSAEIPNLLGNPRYGRLNEYPAPKARILHHMLSTLSHFLWMFPLFLFGVNLWHRKKRSELSTLPAEQPFIFQEYKTWDENREIGKQSH